MPWHCADQDVCLFTTFCNEMIRKRVILDLFTLSRLGTKGSCPKVTMATYDEMRVLVNKLLALQSLQWLCNKDPYCKTVRQLQIKMSRWKCQCSFFRRHKSGLDDVLFFKLGL